VHHGPIWCLKISYDGCFIATAGQDSIVRVWILDAAYRAEMRSPTPHGNAKPPDFSFSPSSIPNSPSFASSIARIVNPSPYREFSGHTADIIDLSWSQTNFILSASVDKTVRLWHVSRGQCLSVFSHPDMVTSVAFHPLEDRHFISGCFDKKVRMWDIPDHRVIEWKQTSHIVTAVQFTPQGSLVVAGLYDGTCVLFNSSGLRYHTQIECRNHRGNYSNGRKVTGLDFDRRGSIQERTSFFSLFWFSFILSTSSLRHLFIYIFNTSTVSNQYNYFGCCTYFCALGEHMLVTTNDNRIRIYSLTDYSCRAKFKGLDNESLQIRASWNEESQSIICGSDSENVYCWNIPPVCITNVPTSSDSSSSNKVHKVGAYEYFAAGKRTITCAQFLPRLSRRMAYEDAPHHLALVRNLIIATDMKGTINLYESQWPPS
jgi:WD40 repeat protein